MKKLFVIFLITINFKASAQKQSWTTYFPVSNNVIGHTFIGSNPQDAKIQEDVENVVVKTSPSATSFTKDQKTTTEFIWNKLFSKNSLRLADVDAHGVRIDQINRETLNEMPRNVPFVYAALKADSSTITFRKAKKIKIDSSPIIDSLKKIYPTITDTELGKFVDFLKFSYEGNDSTDFKMTIKDSSVYFLVQVAEIDKIGGTKWDRYCASFLSVDNSFVDRFTLVDSLDFYKTGNANPHFSFTTRLFNSVQKATVWLEMDKAKNLVVHSQISPTEVEKTKILTERNGTWHYNNIVVRSYPYRAGRSSENYKDIILIINARRDGSKIIVESGATDNACGETYLNYPESQLRWINFRL
jgi:hypothetical protein